MKNRSSRLISVVQENSCAIVRADIDKGDMVRISFIDTCSGFFVHESPDSLFVYAKGSVIPR